MFPIIQSYWYFANSIFSQFIWFLREISLLSFMISWWKLAFIPVAIKALMNWLQNHNEENKIYGFGKPWCWCGYLQMLHDIVYSISFAALHCAQCWDIKQGHEKPKQDIFDRWLPPIWISSDPTTRYLDWSSGCYKTSSQCWSTSQSAYLDLPDVEFVTRVNNDIFVK